MPKRPRLAQSDPSINPQFSRRWADRTKRDFTLCFAGAVIDINSGRIRMRDLDGGLRRATRREAAAVRRAVVAEKEKVLRQARELLTGWLALEAFDDAV